MWKKSLINYCLSPCECIVEGARYVTDSDVDQQRLFITATDAERSKKEEEKKRKRDAMGDLRGSYVVF
jgi:hypothetical protein